MNRCLSTLSTIKSEGYSARALQRLADRRRFPHRLPFSREEVVTIRSRTIQHLSISGVQEKLSLRLERGQLTPIEEGGEYILKPVPGQQLPRFQSDVPANENLTMQIAEQVFQIPTAANACIYLANEELAYITRRFDRAPDGQRIAQEDFCQLMNRTPETFGAHYKYSGSYEELAQTLMKVCGAYPIEARKLFRLILFNYLVANGDAHLKNFSVQQSSLGDFLLTPAYDLLCTKLHLPHESRLALDLFANDELPKGVTTHGFVTGQDMAELGRRFGLGAGFVDETIAEFCSPPEMLKELVDASFLTAEAKQTYQTIIDDRRRALEL